jgi:glycine dehydrogenase subunit 1
MPFIPHTPKDTQEMLAAIGVNSIDALFDEIPASLRANTFNIPAGLTEMQITQLAEKRAAEDSGAACFIGAGAYEHHIPAAVWDIATRGEFMTAYTPYQAEASQGTLQLLYEYQTMMASLMGLDVSNASLYDGASALAEAILMAVRANKHAKGKRILLPTTVHPNYRKVVRAIVQQQDIELIEIAYDKQTGCINTQAIQEYGNQEITALILPLPNFLGLIEDIDVLTNWAHSHDIMVIAVVNPTAVALFKEPGQWGEKGADIACGEGQPLGIPLASGGPYFGFLCCKLEYIRQMPGRIIGQTTDLEGKRGFTLTLQAREQHIRRSKATSNICTNQGLAVTAATIYLSLLGYEGLRRVALACHQNSRELLAKLVKIPGVQQVYNKPYFHEFVLKLPRPAQEVLSELASKGIQAGYALDYDYPQLDNCILICVTETKTSQDLANFAQQLAAILT